MLIISLLPQAPCSHQEDVHKQWSLLVFSASVQQSEPVPSAWPKHPNLIPALLAERASEEEVFHHFLRGVLAKHASVGVARHDEVPASQHVPSVKTINKQQPAKHFEFDRAFSFP